MAETRIPKELIRDVESIGNGEGTGNSGSSSAVVELGNVIVREGLLETGVYSFTTDKVANASNTYTELYLNGIRVPSGSYTLTTREEDTLVTLKYPVSKDTWFNISIFQGLTPEITNDTRVDIWETGPGIPFDYGIDPSEDDGTDGIKFRVCADAANVNYFNVANGTLPVDNYDVYINGELTEQKCNALTFAANDTIEIKAHDGVVYYPYFKPNTNSVIQKILKPLPLMCNTWNSPTVVTDYSSEFYYCYSLTDICEGLFKNFKEHIKVISQIFYGCELLRYLPSDLFSNCTNLTTIKDCFRQCIQLKTIGSNLFYNCNNIVMQSLSSTSSPFSGCQKLESIGSNTFANCRKIDLSNPSALFSSCKQSLREIGSGTFANCESITSLNSLFNGFTFLEKIGSNTFANCINCTQFNNVFSSSNLETIDSSTFTGCTDATTFSATFSSCKNLKNIPQDLFSTNSKATTFTNCFSNDSAIISNVPDLWNTHPNATNTSSCFANCTNAANYSDIPTSWR